MKITNNLAYLLGALRDGSLPKPSKNKYEVTIVADLDESWIKNVAEITEKTFNILRDKLKIYKVMTNKSKQPFYRLKVYSKQLHKLLTKFYPIGSQQEWRTPNKIKKAIMNQKIYYLSGFYDAEGGCRDADKFLRGITKSINCEAAIRCKHNYEINEPLEFIQSILNEFKIKSSIRKNKTGLIITGKQNLLKFYKTFKLLNLRKKKMLEDLLKYYKVLSSVEA